MAEIMRLEGIGLSYLGPPLVRALREVDLVVNEGDYLSVVGPSGSGKSTFLNVVGLLDVPTEGRYWIDGKETSQLTERQRTSLRGALIGFVFQSFHLLAHRTAAENVAMGMLYNATPRSKRPALVQHALTQVGLGHRADALPTQLSGGERQRVAIARAIAARPSVLLCDEPTGNLDTRTSDGILTLLEELHHRGLTIIVITHDPHVAAQATRSVRIRDGLLTEER